MIKIVPNNISFINMTFRSIMQIIYIYIYIYAKKCRVLCYIIGFPNFGLSLVPTSSLPSLHFHFQLFSLRLRSHAFSCLFSWLPLLIQTYLNNNNNRSHLLICKPSSIQSLHHNNPNPKTLLHLSLLHTLSLLNPHRFTTIFPHNNNNNSNHHLCLISIFKTHRCTLNALSHTQPHLSNLQSHLPTLLPAPTPALVSWLYSALRLRLPITTPRRLLLI